MLPGLGFSEILFVLLIVLLLFGPQKLPEFARSIGRAMNEFRGAADDVKNELNMHNYDEPSEKKTPPSSPS